MTHAMKAIAERLVHALKKGNVDAVALELAALHESAVACAVVRVERELRAALEAEQPDELGPFGEVATLVHPRKKRRPRG